MKANYLLMTLLMGASLLTQAQSDPELDFQGAILYQDVLSKAALGSFPDYLLSSAGGEVVEVNDKKGFKFYPNSNVMLGMNELPPNFALEFELTLRDVPPSLYNTYFNVYFQDLKVIKHNDPKNKFGAFGFSLWGDAVKHDIDIFNKKAAFEIKEKIPYDLNGNVIDKTARFTAMVQGNRLRLFINGEKVADSPNLLDGVSPKFINFRLNGTKKEEGHSFIISNIKVTALEKDLRAQLIDEGLFSTSNILFASGSANLQANSYPLLNQIGSLIEGDNGNFLITGHTDSDGDTAANQKLSEDRAIAVKTYLLTNFKIDGARLQTAGKGEAEAVGDNDTEAGKAQNRRVEFKKL